MSGTDGILRDFAEQVKDRAEMSGPFGPCRPSELTESHALFSGDWLPGGSSPVVDEGTVSSSPESLLLLLKRHDAASLSEKLDRTSTVRMGKEERAMAPLRPPNRDDRFADFREAAAAMAAAESSPASSALGFRRRWLVFMIDNK